MVCPHPENDRARLGAAQARAGGRPEGHGRPCAPGTRAARPSSRRTPCSAPPISPDRRLPALRRAHLVGRGARRRAAAARRRHRHRACRDLPALPHARRRLVGRRRRQDQPAAARSATIARRCGRASRNGSVDTVATDHVHRDISAKAGGIWTASPGCPGLETLLPVMLSEGHHARGISLGADRRTARDQSGADHGLRHRKGAHRGRARRGPRAGRPERHDRWFVRDDVRSAARAIRSTTGGSSRAASCTRWCAARLRCATARWWRTRSDAGATSGGNRRKS